MPRKTPEERFWSKVDKKGPDECWNWRGSTRKWGYGRITIKGRYLQAHRVSWELHYGSIPGGLFVLHKCDNRLCVNPNHLELGTQLKNMQDASIRGRRVFCKGEEHGSAKLTFKQVKEIRTSKLSRKDLSKKYKVSRVLIGRIINNKLWVE